VAGNHSLDWAMRHRIAPRAFALLETKGSARVGLAAPSWGNGLDSNTFWVVSARSRSLPCQWDAAIGRAIATAPLTVRIDLD
jgi:hypothetical protein